MKKIGRREKNIDRRSNKEELESEIEEGGGGGEKEGE